MEKFRHALRSAYDLRILKAAAEPEPLERLVALRDQTRLYPTAQVHLLRRLEVVAFLLFPLDFLKHAVKRIAELAGGEVTVKSEQGKGSRFRVRLPL